ncbi:hypothetical protein D3C73_1184110 [compost metagenome]
MLFNKIGNLAENLLLNREDQLVHGIEAFIKGNLAQVRPFTDILQSHVRKIMLNQRMLTGQNEFFTVAVAHILMPCGRHNRLLSLNSSKPFIKS